MTSLTEKQFEILKLHCIAVWNTYGYATSKINRIKDIGNIADNAEYMVAMFDIGNQLRLKYYLMDSYKKELQETQIVESDLFIVLSWLINLYKQYYNDFNVVL